MSFRKHYTSEIRLARRVSNFEPDNDARAATTPALSVFEIVVSRTTGSTNSFGRYFRPRFCYEHQNPLASVAWLIGLHLPGPGFPVVPQSRQIQ
jgi:hypothetical protein